MEAQDETMGPCGPWPPLLRLLYLPLVQHLEWTCVGKHVTKSPLHFLKVWNPSKSDSVRNRRVKDKVRHVAWQQLIVDIHNDINPNQTVTEYRARIDRNVIYWIAENVWLVSMSTCLIYNAPDIQLHHIGLHMWWKPASAPANTRRFSSVLMLGKGMETIQGLLHGQSSCDISSDLINLHSILGQNQSPSAGVAGMGCLVKPRGRKQGCRVPAERWSTPAKHTPSETEASTTRRLRINDVDELINQRWACLQLPFLLRWFGNRPLGRELWNVAPFHKWCVISLKGVSLLFSVHSYCEVSYAWPLWIEKTWN